jgi:hypothetical protein
MITLGASYAIDSAKHVTVETAYSNADPNLFSEIDNAAHNGYAAHITYDESRMISKTCDITLNSRASYEFVDKKFKALERFRNVEFARDWNITTSEKSENEHLGVVSLSLQKKKLGEINYQFGT